MYERDFARINSTFTVCLRLQDYLWNQPHSTRSLGRDFRLRHGAGHGIIAAANAAQHHPGHLAAAGRSRSLGAGINREEERCQNH